MVRSYTYKQEAPMSRTPTAFEQAMMEYVNQARMNPLGEYDVALSTAEDGSPGTQSDIDVAVRYFGVDLEAYRTQMTAFDPVAPLAWNSALATAATTHTELMIETDTQSHNLPGEATLGARITEAGYTGWATVAENIYAYTKNPLFGHAGFMIDWGYDDADYDGDTLRSDWQTIGDGIQDPAGHRLAIMSDKYSDIGIGVLAETNPSTSVGPYLVTQNFGTLQGGSPVQLLGVFIEDGDGDGFYDIDEGRGGVTITATGTTGTFTTTTWESGGYQMELESGTYTVVFSGGSITGTASYEITMGQENVKLDSSTSELQSGSSQPSTGTPVVQEGTPQDDIMIGAAGPADYLLGQAGNDLLMGDGFRTFYFPEVSAQVFRLYQATLGREPDVTGHENWTRKIALDGIGSLEVAQGFVESPEFSARFNGQDNGSFVELLYANVLGRTADAGGLARWTGDLDAGVARAQVVLGFSDSVEFINTTAQPAQAFANAAAPMTWSDDVFRLYQATLDRAPDLGGFMNWTARLGAGMAFEDVAAGFVGSPEFRATYADLETNDFVSLLYANVLNRPADADGLANWGARIEGGMTRAQVVEGFSQSLEFVTATAGALSDWMRTQGTNDTLEGGTGNDVMAGGILSDTFVLKAFEETTQILDLEVWDTLDLSALGYGSQTQARDAFYQDGADVVFDNGAGTVATLIGTNLALLSDEMILI
jgi:serralysin